MLKCCPNEKADLILRQTFINQAKSILAENNSKPTMAVVSLMSGLQRPYVTKAFKNTSKQITQLDEYSLPSDRQMVSKRLGQEINYLTKNKEIDFVTLVKETHKDLAAKIILNELQRLGMMEVSKNKKARLSFFDSKRMSQEEKHLRIRQKREG